MVCIQETLIANQVPLSPNTSSLSKLGAGGGERTVSTLPLLLRGSKVSKIMFTEVKAQESILLKSKHM